MGALDQLNFTCWRWREFQRKRWQRQRRWILAVLFGPWHHWNLEFEYSQERERKVKVEKVRARRKEKDVAKAGWDGWNQRVETDKTSCMSSLNYHDSTCTIDSWYYWALPVVVWMSSQTGCPCRSCLCQEKGRRGRRKMMKMRLGSDKHDGQVKRSTSVKIYQSLRLFNPQFVAFQDEYEEGEYYEEDDGDITGDEKGSQMLLVRSHVWTSHDRTLVMLPTFALYHTLSNFAHHSER